MNLVRPSRRPLRGLLRMRPSLNAIKDLPHALMSVFARWGRDDFCAPRRWRVGRTWCRCKGLEAGRVATVDRSLMRGLGTDMIVCVAGLPRTELECGPEAAPHEDEGSPDLATRFQADASAVIRLVDGAPFLVGSLLWLRPGSVLPVGDGADRRRELGRGLGYRADRARIGPGGLGQ